MGYFSRAVSSSISMLDGAGEKCEMMLSVGTKPQRAVVLWCCGAVATDSVVVVEVCRGTGGGGNIREMDISICRDDPSHDVMASWWCKE